MTAIAWISLVALLVAVASLVWNVINARKIRQQPRQIRQAELRLNIQDLIYDLLEDLSRVGVGLESGQRAGEVSAHIGNLDRLLDRRQDDVQGISDYQIAGCRQLISAVRRAWLDAVHENKMLGYAVDELELYRTKGNTTPKGLRDMEGRIRHCEAVKNAAENKLHSAIEAARAGLEALRGQLRALDTRN
ncbi:hypothetical protein [Sanguibacter inulinus]|uniref:Uncharacterized protein n=1 Tax=Sanguibacter inulinus TaxID=60922 RepID=A0A853EX45_9MICO|nr:hypothetical protein [Sanguibacter inulinus]MBF0724072.1 hypothetical protein [Sanguibacter inulinus]NYS95217.1 hypothetical protein [Sanguibacter inulinus]